MTNSASSVDTTNISGTDRCAALVDRHRERLDQAIAAAASREFFAPFPESPSPRIYGENAAAEGEAAFKAALGAPFASLDSQPATDTWIGEERSPYGVSIATTYPGYTTADFDRLISAAQAGMRHWREAGPRVRAAVCAEALTRLNQRSFEIAHQVMVTTGQPFVMSFQAGGPHAQDRGLEAVAYALAEQERIPAHATWVKPGKREDLSLEKTFTVIPRGVALVIGCNTFPTWNGYPGIFASLATGNPVLVKPHPHAVLPLATTVAIIREVLVECGFDPNLAMLVAENDGQGLAKDLATHAGVAIIDYTGGPTFGDWLEKHADQAQVFTEKAGLNSVIIDSTDNVRGLCANLAFSLALYSGQMCTAPQNLYVSRSGIETDQGHLSLEQFVEHLGAAIAKLTGDDAQAVQLLGANVNPDVTARVDKAAALGEVVVATREITHPDFPQATVRTPTVVRVEADDDAFWDECFGPVSFVIATSGTEQSLELAQRSIQAKGALTMSLYSTDAAVIEAAEDVAINAGVCLSVNYTGHAHVNQSAAFSDFHGTGANPAANAALTDAAFVARRFHVVETRRHTSAN